MSPVSDRRTIAAAPADKPSLRSRGDLERWAPQLTATVLAETIAVLVVSGAVIGPGAYLFRVAWIKGGTAKTAATISLAVALTLVAWLYAARDPDETAEERISSFIGAWGVLFMVIGLAVIAGSALGEFRDRKEDDADP